MDGSSAGSRFKNKCQRRNHKSEIRCHGDQGPPIRAPGPKRGTQPQQRLDDRAGRRDQNRLNSGKT